MKEKILKWLPEIVIISLITILFVFSATLITVLNNENNELRQENNKLKTEYTELDQDVAELSEFYDGFFEYLIENEVQFDPNDEWQLVRLVMEYLSIDEQEM